MPVNSKHKGNVFEREISNALSLRFEEWVGVPKGFVRRPDSGAYFGGKNRTRTETHLVEIHGFGDIITPEAFHWSVECKHYKTPPSLNALMTESCPDLERWCKQAEQDAKSAGKLALLIIKYNNCKTLVMVMEEELNMMACWPVEPSRASFRFKGWLAYTFEDFFRNDDWCYFKTTVEDMSKLKFRNHENLDTPNEQSSYPIHTAQPLNGASAPAKQLPEDGRFAE